MTVLSRGKPHAIENPLVAEQIDQNFDAAFAEIAIALRATETSALAVGARAYVIKSATESDITATLQDDDDLFFSVVANAIYAIEMVLFTNTASGASNAEDLKFGFTYPASATITFAGLTFTVAATTQAELQQGSRFQNSSPSTAFSGGIVSGAQGSPFVVKGILRIGSTDGVFRLQWAQNSVNAANAAQVKVDSYIAYERLR